MVSRFGSAPILGRVARADLGHSHPIALLAIARGPSGARPADFLLLVQQRSGRVLNVAGKLAVIPKGFHQHLTSAIDEVHIGTTLSRELEEEVFGRSDFDESEGRSPLPLNPHHESRLTPRMQWLLEHDACDMECLGLGINLVSGNYEFPSLITISDPRFWDELSGACLPNWEAQEIQLHSTRNADLLADLIQDPRWTNEGLFAFTRGLFRLAEQHPDRVQLPQLEVTAYA